MRWWLDGTKIRDVTLSTGAETLETTFDTVRYKKTHKVTGQVWEVGAEGIDTLLARASAEVDDPLKLWSWTESNGTATDDETRAGYAAAVNQGMTKAFSRSLWNDLVTVTEDTINSIGVLWNTRYAQQGDTMMVDEAELTDKRFNSLALNLQTPYPYWSYQVGRKGYLGRRVVYGQAARGELADIVYGDYLLELAHLLNVLLDAIGGFGAGYADLLDHTAHSHIYSSAVLPMSVPGSRRLALSDTVAANSSKSYLRAPGSRPMGRTDKIVSRTELTGSAPPSKHINLTNRNRSVRSFDFVAQNERALYLTHLLGSAGDIVLVPDPAAALKIVRAIASAATAALSPDGALSFAAALSSLTETAVTLFPSPSTHLIVGTGSVTVTSSGLEVDESLHLACKVEGALLAGSTAELTSPESRHMAVDRTETLANTVSAALTPAWSRHMAANLTAPDGQIDAVLSPAESKHMAVEITERMGDVISADFTPAASKHLTAELRENAGDKTDAALTPVDSLPLTAEITAADGQTDAVLTPVDSLYLTAETVAPMNDTISAVLTPEESTPFAASAASGSGAEAELFPDQAVHAAHSWGIEPQEPPELRAPAGADGELVSVSLTAFSAALQTELALEWVIRRGNDLYIRCVFFAAQHEGDLEIDTYLAPIRRGNDLYIREVWSSYQDRNELDIDLAVFYKPYQSGNDLYIRSADTVWTDGDEANIDTDFFLAPVQTGSDLYIRQDVFGG